MMRKLNLALLCLMTIAMAAGCAQKKVDLEAERTALRTADTEWSATAGNVDTWMTYIAPDGVIQPPMEPAVSGTDNIRAWATRMMGMPGFSVSWEPQTVEVAASGDIGYTAGTYTFSGTDPSGQPFNDHGKYLCTWKKDTSGAWKVAIDTWNSDVNTMPMAADSAATDTTKTR